MWSIIQICHLLVNLDLLVVNLLFRFIRGYYLERCPVLLYLRWFQEMLMLGFCLVLSALLSKRMVES